MVTFLFTLLALTPVVAALTLAATSVTRIRRRAAIRSFDPNERDTLPSGLPAYLAAGGFGWRERGKV